MLADPLEGWFSRAVDYGVVFSSLYPIFESGILQVRLCEIRQIFWGGVPSVLCAPGVVPRGTGGTGPWILVPRLALPIAFVFVVLRHDTWCVVMGK